MNAWRRFVHSDWSVLLRWSAAILLACFAWDDLYSSPRYGLLSSFLWVIVMCATFYLLGHADQQHSWRGGGG